MHTNKTNYYENPNGNVFNYVLCVKYIKLGVYLVWPKKKKKNHCKYNYKRPLRTFVLSIKVN